jgi:hypothetical protein
MTRRILFSLVATIGAVLGLQGSASAALTLELVSGASDVVGAPLGPNSMSFAGTVGAFDVTVTIAVTNSPGTAALGSLTITNFNVSLNGTASAGDNTLTIYAKATDYTLPPGSPLNMDSNESGTFVASTAGDKVTFTSYFDASNTAPGTLPPTGFTIGTPSPTVTITSTGGTTGSLSANAAPTLVTRSGMFALANVTTVTLSGSSSTVALGMNGATTVTGVPEPSSMALAGLGALGLMGYGLRRRQAQGA